MGNYPRRQQYHSTHDKQNRFGPLLVYRLLKTLEDWPHLMHLFLQQKLEKINNKNVSFKYLEELIFKYGICLTNNEIIKHAMNYENYALREHNWFYNRNPKNNKNLYFQEHKDYLNILSDSLTNREREILFLRYGLLDGRKNSYKNIKEKLLYRSYYELFIEIINLNWKLKTYLPGNFIRNYILGYFINASDK